MGDFCIDRAVIFKGVTSIGRKFWKSSITQISQYAQHWEDVKFWHHNRPTSQCFLLTIISQHASVSSLCISDICVHYTSWIFLCEHKLVQCPTEGLKKTRFCDSFHPTMLVIPTAVYHICRNLTWIGQNKQSFTH